jgi:hypothetical protein
MSCSYFYFQEFSRQTPREYGQTCNVTLKVKNSDSENHLADILLEWRKKGSSDSWHVLYEDTIIINGSATESIYKSFSMPNYDVEIYAIVMCTEGGNWYLSDDDEIYVYLTEPTVTTNAASGIDDDSAYLNGYTTYWYDTYGFKYRKKGASTWLDWHYVTNGHGNFSRLVSGLDACTTYEFYAYAENDDGPGIGATLEFTTTGSVPIMLTKAATGISTTSAFLVGQINSKEGGTVDHYGFDYGKTTGYGTRVWIDDFPVSEDTDFSKLIESLDEGTLYHFRAVAHTECGYGYGADKTFTTLSSALTPGYFWIDQTDDCIYYTSATGKLWHITGFTKGGAAGATPGYIWIEGTALHYIDYDGFEWYGVAPLTSGGATGKGPGYIWIEGEYLHYIDASGDERSFE